MFNENVNPIGREANHIFSQSECSLVADPGFWPWPLLISNTAWRVLFLNQNSLNFMNIKVSETDQGSSKGITLEQGSRSKTRVSNQTIPEHLLLSSISGNGLFRLYYSSDFHQNLHAISSCVLKYFYSVVVYMNHINNEKHMYHGFLAPRAYLFSTSLTLL